ncbi:MAG: substrate-binding domain-containing protein [Pseudomonadota bacterium]|nr:substrate-binding domain-containing protein [Pseudomonadota bacterium]
MGGPAQASVDTNTSLGDTRMVRMIAAVVALLLSASFAHAESLRILTTGAFKQVVLELIPAFEKRTGASVEVAADTAGGLLKRIEAGETFDIVFLTPAGLRSLVDQGKVQSASVMPVAKVAIGVAVLKGAAVPSLRTAEEFKTAVLNARKIAYIDPASGGSSGVYLEGLFQRLGIADAVRQKSVLVFGGAAAERVAAGEADLAIHQVSEILSVRGVVLAGLLPAAIQNYTVYGTA